MKSIKEKIEGNYSVTEDTELHGQIAGDVSVATKATLILYGQIAGSLLIKEGSAAVIHGQVTEDVTNNGGMLSVFGMIVGNLYENAGTTSVEPGAHITNKKVAQ